MRAARVRAHRLHMHCAVPALLHTPLRLHTEDRKLAQGDKQVRGRCVGWL